MLFGWCYLFTFQGLVDLSLFVVMVGLLGVLIVSLFVLCDLIVVYFGVDCV